MRGEPPPPTLKVSLNTLGGFRNAMTFVLTGLDIEAKAELVRRQLETGADRQARRAGVDAGPHRPPRRRHRGGGQRAAALRGPRPRPDEGRTPVLLGRSRTGAGQLSRLHHHRAARRRPGRTACSPPATSTPTEVPHVAVHADGTRVEIAAATETRELEPVADRSRCPSRCRSATTRRVPLGAIAGARSGDKGGNANVGVWVRTDDAVALAGAHADRRQAARTAARDAPICRSPATCCRTCAR